MEMGPIQPITMAYLNIHQQLRGLYTSMRYSTPARYTYKVHSYLSEVHLHPRGTLHPYLLNKIVGAHRGMEPVTFALKVILACFLPSCVFLSCVHSRCIQSMIGKIYFALGKTGIFSRGKQSQYGMSMKVSYLLEFRSIL
jgi:hypothetical protein